MPRTSALLVALLVALAGCSPSSTEPAKPATQASAPSASAADNQFSELSSRWLDGAMRLSPVFATTTGDHRFDAELDDLSAEGRARSVDFSRGMLADLDRIAVGKLSRENQVDASVLRNQLRYDLWTTESLQSWAWDPMLYSQLAGGALYSLMARDFAPHPPRRSAGKRSDVFRCGWRRWHCL